MASKETRKMFGELVKKTRRNKLILWTTLPITLTAVLGGAIYFAVKNNRPITKPFVDIENFNQLADEVKIKTNSELSVSPNDLLKNFEERKDSKDFDIDAYLSFTFSKDLDFDKNKKLRVKFLNIERSATDNSIKLTYEVTLNYDNVVGSYETSKTKGTSKSKYYKVFTVTIPYETTAEDLSNNLEFNKNVQDAMDAIRKIITSYDKDHDKDGAKWFASLEFRNQVWEWFSNIFNKSNAYPDLYSPNLYELKPYLGKDNNANHKYVEWIPKLNSLTIDYQFVERIIEQPGATKKEPIKSPATRKIFTINV